MTPYLGFEGWVGVFCLGTADQCTEACYHMLSLCWEARATGGGA